MIPGTLKIKHSIGSVNLFTLIVGLFMLMISVYGYSQNVTAQKVGDKVEFRADGRLITSYVVSEHEKYPYFFPVNGPSNASVTSMRNANYPHHSSLFFGCDKVNGGNFWQEELERGQILSIRTDVISAEADKAIIENECIWKRPGADAPIKDKRIISVSVPASDKYQIDFEIKLEMLQEVTIQKTNHSLFSARLDPDLAVINNGVLINAEGQSGEKATWGKKSAWMDYYGERMGKMEGIAILQHPSNKWFPSPWFTRDYGFFSPTPMYWPENDNFITLEKGEIVNLKYRVLIHRGNHKDAKIADEYEKFKTE